MVIQIEVKSRDLFLSKSLCKVISDFIFEVWDPLYCPAIDVCLDNLIFLFFEDCRSMEKFCVVIFLSMRSKFSVRQVFRGVLRDFNLLCRDSFGMFCYSLTRKPLNFGCKNQPSYHLNGFRPQLLQASNDRSKGL